MLDLKLNGVDVQPMAMELRSFRPQILTLKRNRLKLLRLIKMATLVDALSSAL